MLSPLLARKITYFQLWLSVWQTIWQTMDEKTEKKLLARNLLLIRRATVQKS